MSAEAITEKVKKLLRLARCKAATAAEAANALNRALELIERHQIDAATLNLDEETERIVEEKIELGKRVSLIKQRVNCILLSHFKVRTCVVSYGGWQSTELSIVGFESDVTIAGYVFHFLVRACQRAVVDFVATERKARRVMNAKKKEDYIYGWMWGVASNLRGQKTSEPSLMDSQTALVLADKKRRVDDRFAELFPDTKKIEGKTKKMTTVAHKGFMAGKSTSIHQPLNGGREVLALE